MSSDGLAPAELVARYLDRHPDASVAEVAGATGLDPATVADFLDEDLDTDTARAPSLEPDSSDANPGGSGRETALHDPDTEARAALTDAVNWFHSQLDRELPAATSYDTARDYWRDGRGYTPETIEEKRLGYAPADTRDRLLDYLHRQGHDREAILATGLFGERDDGNLYAIWTGRYVFPYLDADGQPVFAISRALDPAHPADWAGKYGEDDDPAKYHKLPVSRGHVRVEEPIYGLGSIQPGEPVIITEGIADAITAHQAGYPCLSPVTTTFKKSDRQRLLAVLEEFDVPRVYIAQDAERPQPSVDENDQLATPQYGEGLRGAVRTGAFLADHGVDARIAELPLPAWSDDFHKVDLDDYLAEWDGDLQPVLASATPATDHPAYGVVADSGTATDTDGAQWGNGRASSGNTSALFDLDLEDVTGKSAGYRGKNPLGHHGGEKPWSEDYFTVYEDGTDLKAADHKYGVTYTPLTYLLAASNDSNRSPASPGGSLDDEDTYHAWKQAKDEGLIRDDDPLPSAAIRHVALANDYCDREDLDDGFVPRAAYNAVLDHVAEVDGYDPGREPLGISNDADEDTPCELPPEKLLDNDSTLDRQEAWRAARTVTPDHLAPGLDLDADGDGWRCPTCDAHVTGAVRAHALADGALECCRDPWADRRAYDRHYTALRDAHDAPLPEYISPTQAVDDLARAYGAIGALRGWHIIDSLESDVTDDNPSGADAIAELDPTWEDSDSGRRIVLFSSGLFYCREHERVLWPLQVVGLEQGIIDNGGQTMETDDTLRAYALARTQYGAPLPLIVWNDAEDAPDPLHLPVLPDADDLLGDGVTTDRSGLDDARDAVGDLYERLASGGSGSHLLTALPALGKTYQAITQAADHPTLYTAKRKELRKEAADEARDNGLDWMHLPTLGESRPPEAVLAAATTYVHEHGRHVLRDREELLDAVEDVCQSPDVTWPAYERAYGDDSDDTDPDTDDADGADAAAGEACPGCGQTFDTTARTRLHFDCCPAVAREDDDDVTLDRAACGSGTGTHGPEWQLALWTARKLGDKPRDLHVRGETIFGDAPPCTHVGDCAYTRAWEDATDPDAPVDLLIGHPVHAYVGGARTQPQRTENDTVRSEHRVVALDEFPGDVYTRNFGEEFLQHARWLASCLAPEIEDTTDLIDRRKDLWSDGFVASWLNGDAHPPILDALAANREQADDPDAPAPDWQALLDADLGVDGDLRALVERAVRAAADPDRDAENLLDTAMTALRGGPEGADALGSGAEDGYAHPDAYWLLLGLLAPDEFDGEDADNWRATVTATTRDAEHFDLGSDNGRLKAVTVAGRQRLLLDRDHTGAVLLLPPDLRENTVVGLDATGRSELWELATGTEFDTADIHDTAAERRAFLRDVLNLRVVQTSPHVHTYSGNPTSKNFGDDIALVDEVASTYGGRQLAQDRLTTSTAPAVVTTKKVEDHIGSDLRAAGATTVDHYGDLIGSNRLAEHNIGVILGAEHYGHDEAEKWALLAGEEFYVDGRGAALDYGSDTANAMLNRMRDDKVMQAILRFGRDEEGAVVFAHTCALRDDLPVVDHGDVATAFTDNQRAVARAARDRQGQPFTVTDVHDDDRVDCDRRTVRRTLNQFADLGYLQVNRGHTNEYDTVEDPGTGQADLPDGPPAPPGGGAPTGASSSGQAGIENTNTRFVWSSDADLAPRAAAPGEPAPLGPPGEFAAGPPPG